MKIGVGLPAAIPGVSGAQIIEWAKKADAGPFASVGVIDRLVYDNYEPLITLAAAAAVTSRVRLMPTVLLAPLRGAGMLAKQAASVDALSNGRLTLGLGIGAREDDYQATPTEFRRRGARFEEGLAMMDRIWRGEAPVEGVDPVGPRPVQAGGPEVLLGGSSPPAIERIGRLGYGFLAGGGGPSRAKTNFDIVMAARERYGQTGSPRFVALTYFGISDRAVEGTADAIRKYYSFVGPGADAMAKAIPAGAQAVKDTIKAYEDIGVDEVMFYSGTTDISEVDRLAELVH